MFSTTSVVKPNPFENYNLVLAHFQTIKNLNSFNNNVAISPADLITISNNVTDSIEKLSEISILYIKKNNDSTISVTNIEKLKIMYELHNELMNHIYNFGKISADVVDGMKDISQYNMNLQHVGDISSYIYYDIINRYKIIILKIFEVIKRLNTYANIVKDKINL